MIRNRRTRIVATIGPATNNYDKVYALAVAGVDVFRINFSHGAYEDHKISYDLIRRAEKEIGRPLGILTDLQGPKLRLGSFNNDDGIFLNTGDKYRFVLKDVEGDEKQCTLPHKEIFKIMHKDLNLLVDDGKVRLKVIDFGDDWAEVECIGAGTLKSHKGVNVPGAVLPLSAISEKDRKDISFALELGVDWIGLSFVQRPEDMAELRKLVQGKAAVLAKIEKPAALDALDAILDYCDGVMVARGDLGVELAPEEVPIAQKVILRSARQRGVPTIVATQMLESMINSPTPTRAEASDVANAVYEGTDAIMLSGETAVGKYPLEAVNVMSRIAARVEKDPRWPGLMDAEHANPEHEISDAISVAARVAADVANAKCLVAFSERGTTALRIARERPLQPILTLTPNEHSARKLALAWGMETRVIRKFKDIEEMAEIASEYSSKIGLAPSGERIVIIAGIPFGLPGATNILRIARAK